MKRMSVELEKLTGQTKGAGQISSSAAKAAELARVTASAPPPEAAQGAPEPSPEETEARAEALGHRLATLNVKLKISVDLDTGKRVVRLIDRETEKTLREIPPKELRRLEASIERMIGLFFDKSA